MKTLLTLFVLLFSSTVVAKEYKSIHNISLTLPESYVVFNSVTIDDVYENLKGRFNKEMLQQMISQYKDIPIEYYIKEESLLDIKNNIRDNINIRGIGLVSTNLNGENIILCSITKDLDPSINAGNIIKTLAEEINLKGGGSKYMAILKLSNNYSCKDALKKGLDIIKGVI